MSQYNDSKQHLSNIWSSIREKVKQTEAELKKKNVAYKKLCKTVLIAIMLRLLQSFMKNDCIDEGQSVFEQLTLTDFKICSLKALKKFSN